MRGERSVLAVAAHFTSHTARPSPLHLRLAKERCPTHTHITHTTHNTYRALYSCIYLGLSRRCTPPVTPPKTPRRPPRLAVSWRHAASAAGRGFKGGGGRGRRVRGEMRLR